MWFLIPGLVASGFLCCTSEPAIGTEWLIWPQFARPPTAGLSRQEDGGHSLAAHPCVMRFETVFKSWQSLTRLKEGWFWVEIACADASTSRNAVAAPNELLKGWFWVVIACADASTSRNAVAASNELLTVWLCNALMDVP